MSILHGSYHKPASHSHLLAPPSLPPAFPSPFSEMSRKREMKIKSGEGELGEKKRGAEEMRRLHARALLSLD